MPKLDALGEFDFNSVEVRLLGYFLAKGINDFSLVEEYAAGLDPHSETTKMVLGLDRDPTKQERNIGKRALLSSMYGGGRPTLMRQLDLTWEEAGKLHRTFHAKRPGIRKLQDKLLDTLHSRGYIKTPWGRHLHPQNDHAALNALIQGSAADLMKSALIKLDGWQRQEGLESHLVLTVHDSALWDIRAAELPALVQNVPGLMTDERIEEVIPITVELEISYDSWADKAPYVEEPLAA